jgi:hypothetical protein
MVFQFSSNSHRPQRDLLRIQRKTWKLARKDIDHQVRFSAPWLVDVGNICVCFVILLWPVFILCDSPRKLNPSKWCCSSQRTSCFPENSSRGQPQHASTTLRFQNQKLSTLFLNSCKETTPWPSICQRLPQVTQLRVFISFEGFLGPWRFAEFRKLPLFHGLICCYKLAWFRWLSQPQAFPWRSSADSSRQLPNVPISTMGIWWEYDGDSLNSDNWWTHVDRHQHYPIIAMFHGETMPHVFVYSVQGSIY